MGKTQLPPINDTLKTKNTLSSHSTSVRGRKKKTCPTCKKSIASAPAHFQAHLKTHLAESQRVKYKCSVDQCFKEYFSRSNLTVHVDRAHSQTPKSRLKCDHCLTEFSLTSGLRRHIRQFHSGPVVKYPCNLCDATFRSKTGRDDHIVGTHTGEKAFKCQECPAKFSSSSILRVHQFVHKEARPIKCQVCSKSFKRPGEVARHVKTFHTERKKDVQCPICQKSFFTMRDLSQHSKTHDRGVTFSCYFCPKAFQAKANRDRHLRIHTQEKPFSCSEQSCQYSTGYLNLLRKHANRYHTPVSYQPTPSRIWTCYFCSKTCSQFNGLVIHISRHTLESPFTCGLCQKSFNRKGRLEGHIFTHTKERPLKCPHLSKMFPKQW